MDSLTASELEYLELLAKDYPNVNQVCTEIINLKAILNLPKGTEHFVSDIHGEREAFSHVLRNASGVIKGYINEIFGFALQEHEKKSLAMLIYYPERKLLAITAKEDNLEDWYKITLLRLIRICKRASSKYTRSKVRKALPKEFSYIIEELLHEDSDRKHKNEYYYEIIDTIISLGRAPDFIVDISYLIQRLAIDHLHVIGDIYDRGKEADQVMDIIEKYHSVDIQWGNHDISWIGAASGSEACICNVIRISAKYNNLDTLEEGYGINLVPLVTYSLHHYPNDVNDIFQPNIDYGENQSNTLDELNLVAKVHKAITVLQLKVEAEVIARHPEYGMQDRLLLHRIDYDNSTVNMNDSIYPMRELDFPTVDRNDPYRLTEEERVLLGKLLFSFTHSAKLQRHAKFLLSKGSIYRIYNSNLLFHGCIPMEESGELKKVEINGKLLSGKALLDEMEKVVHSGFFEKNTASIKQNGMDFIWYLWCGANSPLFGKDRMATFERYFVLDEKTYEERKACYYDYQESKVTCERILHDFGLYNDCSKIINGHIPVKVIKGESPIKAEGKMIVIDGGFTKAYQKVTGIAGYTLIYSSKGMMLTAHEPFISIEDAIIHEQDIISNTVYSNGTENPTKVLGTDIGEVIMKKIAYLQKLVFAYSTGLLEEK
ncbi:MAG TPA: fructose-1,6-bisphosphatase [Lachnospiraceae bacterium]|nr:fructose-1,6-bisphosphatase [Lachnospiraceae bacterium]